MKLCTILIGIILICNPLLFSQDASESIISGTIKNSNKSFLMINEQSVELDASGQFTYSIEQKKPAYIKLEYDKYFYLYLRPGDHITVSINAEDDVRSVHLSGGDLSINKFLIAEESESAKVNQHFNQNFREIVCLDEDAYVKKIDNLWLPFEQRFENFVF